MTVTCRQQIIYSDQVYFKLSANSQSSERIMSDKNVLIRTRGFPKLLLFNGLVKLEVPFL